MVWVAGAWESGVKRIEMVVAAHAIAAISAKPSPHKIDCVSIPCTVCGRMKVRMTPKKAMPIPDHCKMLKRSAGSFQCKPNATKMGAV